MSVKCTNCTEEDESNNKTGARIDGKYYCEACYDQKNDTMLTEVVDEVFKGWSEPLRGGN